MGSLLLCTDSSKIDFSVIVSNIKFQMRPDLLMALRHLNDPNMFALCTVGAKCYQDPITQSVFSENLLTTDLTRAFLTNAGKRNGSKNRKKVFSFFEKHPDVPMLRLLWIFGGSVSTLNLTKEVWEENCLRLNNNNNQRRKSTCVYLDRHNINLEKLKDDITMPFVISLLLHTTPLSERKESKKKKSTPSECLKFFLRKIKKQKESDKEKSDKEKSNKKSNKKSDEKSDEKSDSEESENEDKESEYEKSDNKSEYERSDNEESGNEENDKKKD